MPSLFPYAPPSGRSHLASEARDQPPTPLSGLNDPSAPVGQALINLAAGITIGGAGLAELPAITIDTSVRVSAVYRATALIAGALSTLPLKLYDEAPDGSRTRVSPPENRAVWWEPNPEMDLPTFYKTSFAHNALGGNTYWYMAEDSLGGAAELWPVHPARVRPFRDPLTGRKFYHVDGDSVELDAGYGGQFVHIPNLTLDGLAGLNPVSFARLSLQLARAAEEYGARVFAHGSTPLGVLETDADLEEAQADKLARRWERHHRGFRNANRIAIVDNGAKYRAISLNPQDAQWLENRRFQIQEIARLFGIPPHLLADASNSTSWGSGLEEQTRAMVVFTFGDYTNRFEYALSRRVMRRPGRYARFDYRALLRGSTLQRFQAYNMAIASGWASRQEVREWEDLDAGPPELANFLQPLNMAEVVAADGAATNATRLGDLEQVVAEIKARLDAPAA